MSEESANQYLNNLVCSEPTLNQDQMNEMNYTEEDEPIRNQNFSMHIPENLNNGAMNHYANQLSMSSIKSPKILGNTGTMMKITDSYSIY